MVPKSWYPPFCLHTMFVSDFYDTEYTINSICPPVNSSKVWGTAITNSSIFDWTKLRVRPPPPLFLFRTTRTSKDGKIGRTTCGWLTISGGKPRTAPARRETPFFRRRRLSSKRCVCFLPRCRAPAFHRCKTACTSNTLCYVFPFKLPATRPH